MCMSAWMSGNTPTRSRNKNTQRAASILDWLLKSALLACGIQLVRTRTSRRNERKVLHSPYIMNKLGTSCRYSTFLGFSASCSTPLTIKTRKVLATFRTKNQQKSEAEDGYSSVYYGVYLDRAEAAGHKFFEECVHMALRTFNLI